MPKQNFVQVMYWISGNEAADQLTKPGSACLFTGPEPFCGLSPSPFREVVNAWEWKGISWYFAKAQRRCIMLLKFAAKEIWIKNLAGLLPGRCPLDRHLHKLGLAEPYVKLLCKVHVVANATGGMTYYVKNDSFVSQNYKKLCFY